LIRRIIREPDRPVWGALSALMFFFLVSNMAVSVAFKHSDISWVLIVVASIYTRTAMRTNRRQRSAPRVVGLHYGTVSAWPIAAPTKRNGGGRYV
jgi:hypothetical protein